MNYRNLIATALLCAGWAAGAVTPVFHHSFETAKDASGTYTGTLCNGATLEKVGDVTVVNLGQDNGYFDFGSAMGDKIISGLNGDYTITTTLLIPSETALGANGNFVFNFANSSSTGYAFFGANSCRYSITPTSWTSEQTVNASTTFPQGTWVAIAIKQQGNNATVYIDGVAKATAEITMHPSELGKTSLNWLGRSCYDPDVYLKGAKYADFAIYGSALSDADIKALADDADIKALNDEICGSLIDQTVKSYNFDFSDVRANVTLPGSIASGISCSWASSDKNLITDTGAVTRPAVGQKDATLTLKLTATKAGVTRTYDFPATVRAKMSTADRLQHDLDNIVLTGTINNLRSDLKLPTATAEGTILSWKSANTDYITNAGKLIKLSPKGKKEVTLTATAMLGKEKASRDFSVQVAEDEGYQSYLFAYFPSNSDENLYFALSTDGYNYTPMNNGKRVMASDTVAIKKGIRDPHILRAEDGTFLMVATDMKCAEGWASNRGMVLYKSKDLVNWQHSTVHFPTRFPEWANVTRVWAPEVIWDAEAGKYLVYYSLLTNDGKCPYDKVYYSYANADFTDLETAPEYFYDRGSATIDCDIVYDDRTGIYHMVYKNEGSGGICQVTATRLTPEPGQPAGSQWSNPSGGLQQTTVAVEGAGMFRLINSDKWILMYDCYNNGYYQFCSSDDLEKFTLIAQTTTSGAFTPRHGTVIPITAEETERLLEAFPIDGRSPQVLSARNINVRTNNFKVSGTNVYIPVRPNVDLRSFDPELQVSFGATISPEGAQDFSEGAVEYTVTLDGKSKKFNVTCAIEANPVLPGFNADPEVMYSHKTGRFYIYPTADGYSGWGGYQFNAWSSADLVNWQKETCILDLSTDQVSWATGNAWAPCIEEKLVDGEYKYYFYFSGHNPSKGYKTLGCAVADSPTGPFYDLGEPLIDTNITGGQLIDSDIFTDDDGQTYYYWGNGSLVASKLGADMRTISDARVITPAGGTNSTHAFREGVYVFKRNGVYYFLWSVDDTGSKNYHVAYGTATSPLGPITVAKEPVILIQDGANELYGTAHNSVLQIPGRDEWYIVYHRINKAYLNDGPGYHRETCIDRMEFNQDGTIKKITPTHRGISPVDITNYITGVENVKIADADIDGQVVRSDFYSLSGAAVANPSQHGVYIQVDTLANGAQKAAKILK